MGLDPARAAVRNAVRAALGDGQDVVLVACSGGADSLALLVATVFEGHRAAVRVVGAVVDHALQEGSDEHTARVVGQMAALGVDETASIRVRVDPGPGGIEAGARQARYVALAQLAAHFGAPVVLLGHTRDDQAETVLLGLARGSGGRSLQGMRRYFREGDVAFVRPLLDLTRAQTESACRAEGIEYWSDPHNEDPRFLRARVRGAVLPVMERELGPGISVALARTADQLREDMDVLDTLSDAAYQRARVEDGIDVGRVADAPSAVLSRCARRAAVAAGSIVTELTRAHVLAVLGLLGSHGEKQVQLPGHVTAFADGDVLRFRRTD